MGAGKGMDMRESMIGLGRVAAAALVLAAGLGTPRIAAATPEVFTLGEVSGDVGHWTSVATFVSDGTPGSGGYVTRYTGAQHNGWDNIEYEAGTWYLMNRDNGDVAFYSDLNSLVTDPGGCTSAEPCYLNGVNENWEGITFGPNGHFYAYNQADGDVGEWLSVASFLADSTPGVDGYIARHQGINDNWEGIDYDSINDLWYLLNTNDGDLAVFDSLTALLTDGTPGGVSGYLVRYNGVNDSWDGITTIPEPGTVLLLAAGLLGLGVSGRRRA